MLDAHENEFVRHLMEYFKLYENTRLDSLRVVFDCLISNLDKLSQPVKEQV
jgi:hypothetical protein